MPLQEQKDDKITVLVNTTIHNLKTILQNLQEEKAGEEVAERRIKICFGKAFISLSKKEEKRKLFREISKKVHSDGIEDRLELTKEIAAYLSEKNMLSTPQVILNTFQPQPSSKSLFFSGNKNLIQESMHSFQAFFAIRREIKSLEENLRLSNLTPEDLDEIKINLALKKEKLSESPVELRIIIAMFENPFYRYPMPLDSFVVVIALLAGISVMISWALASSINWLVQYFLSTVTKLLVDLYTEGKGIAPRWKAYTDSQFPEAKAKWFKEYKEKDNLINMSNEEYIEYMYKDVMEIKPDITKKEVEDNIDSFITASIPPPSLTTKLKLLALSIYDTLRQWPKGTANQVLTFFLWPLRFVTAAPLIILVAAVNFISILQSIAEIIIGGTIFLGIMGSLFALNIPLILWDTPGYVIRKIKNCCCAPRPNSADEGEPFLNSSQRRMSAALSATQSPERRSRSSSSTVDSSTSASLSPEGFPRKTEMMHTRNVSALSSIRRTVSQGLEEKSTEESRGKERARSPSFNNANALDFMD